MKMFGTIFFACVMFFAVWVLIGDSPLARLNRGCAPVQWVGKAITSVASIGSSVAESRAAAGTEKAFFTCRYFWFRQFYAEEAAAAQRAREASQKGGQGAAR